MLNVLDKKHQVVEQNRTYIKTVAEVLLFTAMQNISQRGHLETDAYTKKGNFLGIMDLIAKHSPLIDKKLKAVGNAKYTSNIIQNGTQHSQKFLNVCQIWYGKASSVKTGKTNIFPSL